MCKPNEYINNVCIECNPRNLVKTLAKFTGEIGTYSDCGEMVNEYLYECCQCGLKSWVDDCWMRSFLADAPTEKTVKQRQEYINRKTDQLDNITDARKYTHRLTRIMRYHKLLTDVEMDEIKGSLK